MTALPELETLLASLPADDARGRRVATLDFDNTCIRGDSGERMHLWLCRRLAWDLPTLIEQVDPREGQERLRTLTNRLRQTDPGDPHYRQLGDRLTAELVALFSRHLARTGPEATYRWAATLHAGMSVARLQQEALAMWAREQQLAPGRDTLSTDQGEHLSSERGLRPRAAMRDLIARLEAAGVEVWIVSATNVWTVQALAPSLGVPPERVIGNACVVREGIISAERAGPVTYGAGKVEAIRQRIGVRPLLAMGDSRTDREMLHFAERACLVDRGDAALREEARSSGWQLIAQQALDRGDG